MNEVVFKTLKEKDFILKTFLIKLGIELNLTLDDFLLIVYFMNQEELHNLIKEQQIPIVSTRS